VQGKRKKEGKLKPYQKRESDNKRKDGIKE
jgi:hypothetical protein